MPGILSKLSQFSESEATNKLKAVVYRYNLEKTPTSLWTASLLFNLFDAFY